VPIFTNDDGSIAVTRKQIAICYWETWYVSVHLSSYFIVVTIVL
jgi:hypothetical protein